MGMIRSASSAAPGQESGQRTMLLRFVVITALSAVIFGPYRLLQTQLYVGDVFLALSAVSACILSSGRMKRLPSYLVWGCIFLVVAALGGYTYLLHPPIWFNPVRFITSLIRLGLMLVLSAPIAMAIGEYNDRQAVHRTINAVVVAHAIVGLVLYAAAQFGLNTTLGASVVYEGAITRARGLMDEPANFGAFQAFGFAWLLLAPPLRRRNRILGQGLVCVSIVASLSLVGIAIAVATVVAASTRAGGVLSAQGNIRSRSRRLVTIALIAGGILVGPGFGAPVRQATFGRAMKALRGKDASATARVTGSWAPTQVMLDRAPITGSSLGNLGSGALAALPELVNAGLREDRFSWNAVALVAGSTGLAGLIAWMAMVLSLYRTRRGGALIVVAWMFGTSVIQLPTLWIALAFVAGAWPIRRRTRPRSPTATDQGVAPSAAIPAMVP
jgi:hypothetical protein